MPETPEGQQRTEPPTPKHLEEARLRGQVAKSADMTATAVLIGALLLFAGLLPGAVRSFQGLLEQYLQWGATVRLDESSAYALAWDFIVRTLLLLLPAMAVVLALGVGAELAQVGVRFATKKFPQGLPLQTVFNPLVGLRRVFLSGRSAVELLKSVLKIALVIGIAAQVLWGRLEELIQLAVLPLPQAASVLWNVVVEATVKIVAALLLLALGDVLYQRYRYREDLRMTRQEVRDELKQTEGDPQLKARLRSLLQQRLRRWLLQRVRQADAVITNPTHVAVALQYTPQKMRAPIVVAKGANRIAEQIRQIAQEAGVPIIERPALAWSLYRGVEVDQEIPERLFAAVAEVLAYVYHVYNRAKASQILQSRR
ncbi:MAG: flagellar biosynthesis protein FlhB [Candidatus Kapabacteria bacterium]|nr:flagellar biosynthesis protein FlhB [Candidatus Kapabacteria bacterium]MDW8011758.1 flagellar biosynthesis protein FlhB [Bacteroidota bacterium]